MQPERVDMTMNHVRSASPSGSRASHEAASSTASSPEASIPNAPLSRVGEMDLDVMECGGPETALHEVIRHFRWRANCEASVARELRQTADAAKADADLHSEQAEGFLMLATALERAPVAFPAIATEAHRAATVEQGAVHEGAGPQDIAQGPSQ